MEAQPMKSPAPSEKWTREQTLSYLMRRRDTFALRAAALREAGHVEEERA